MEKLKECVSKEGVGSEVGAERSDLATDEIDRLGEGSGSNIPLDG